MSHDITRPENNRENEAVVRIPIVVRETSPRYIVVVTAEQSFRFSCENRFPIITVMAGDDRTI